MAKYARPDRGHSKDAAEFPSRSVLPAPGSASTTISRPRSSTSLSEKRSSPIFNRRLMYRPTMDN